MTYADTLPDSVRKKSRIYAIVSALFGCVSEQILDSNTLLILYLVMLGGSDSFSMLSTALTGVAYAMLSIPAAGIVNKIGLKMSYSSACYVSSAAFLAIAAAPFSGAGAPYVVMGACLIYCLARPMYATAWYPMLDVFLRANERGWFFGKMRFSYMILNAFLIFGSGWLMGENPNIWILQAIFAVAGLFILGRKFCMDKFPSNPEGTKTAYDLISSLKVSVRNGPLVGFAVYLSFLNLSALAAFPLAVVYMKTGLDLGAFTIMTITSAGLVGSISGFGCVGFSMRYLGMKKYQILTHLMFLFAIGGLLCITRGYAWNPYLLGGLFFLNGFATAFLLCLGSTEMMALARPGNKVMAMAFCSTFQFIGNAAGRLGATAVLALGALAPSWKFLGNTYTKFHFLFLACLALTLFGMVFLLLCPSVVPKHEDYYEP